MIQFLIYSLVAGSHFNNAVVLDNGCGTIKLGLAGHKKPSVIQPALYGISKRYSLQMAGMDNKKDRRYGDAASMKAGVMQLGKYAAPPPPPPPPKKKKKKKNLNSSLPFEQAAFKVFLSGAVAR